MSFKVGDLVRIKDELPCNMSHFPKGKYAVIEKKLDDQFGLHIKGQGYSAWYPAETLELVAPSQRDTFTQYCYRMFQSVRNL